MVVWRPHLEKKMVPFLTLLGQKMTNIPANKATRNKTRQYLYKTTPTTYRYDDRPELKDAMASP